MPMWKFMISRESRVASVGWRTTGDGGGGHEGETQVSLTRDSLNQPLIRPQMPDGFGPAAELVVEAEPG